LAEPAGLYLGLELPDVLRSIVLGDKVLRLDAVAIDQLHPPEPGLQQQRGEVRADVPDPRDEGGAAQQEARSASEGRLRALSHGCPPRQGATRPRRRTRSGGYRTDTSGRRSSTAWPAVRRPPRAGGTSARSRDTAPPACRRGAGRDRWGRPALADR